MPFLRTKLARAEIFSVLILVLSCLITLLALIPNGYFYTHDGDFHLIRLAHYVMALKEGHFPVRFIPSLAYGYGYPVFNFFYPFPYLLAAFFNFLGVSLGNSLKLVMGLASLGSVLAMYTWLRCHFSIKPALIGSLLYLWVPYRFVTLYVTGQVGGLLAFCWVPLTVWCLFQIIVKRRQVATLLLSIVLSSFLLSHVISVIAFMPLCVLYSLVLLYQHRRTKTDLVRTLTRLGLGGLLSLGLAAFYLLPAIGEKRWTKAGHEVLIRYQDHFPTLKQLLYSPWGYGVSGLGDQDGLSFQIGLAQVAVLLLSLGIMVWLFLKFRKKNFDHHTQLAFGCLGLVAITIWLISPLSLFIWNNLPILQTLQYPWRLLVVLCVLVAYLSAWISTKKWVTWLMILILGLSVFNNRNYLRSMDSQRYDDHYYLTNSNLFMGSTDISWELAPPQTSSAPFEVAQSLVNQPPTLVPAVPSYQHNFTISVEQNRTVSLNLFYYPWWQVKVANQIVAIQPSPEGLISFEVPSGTSQVQVSVVSTPIEKLSNAISLISAGVAVAWFLIILKSHQPSA